MLKAQVQGSYVASRESFRLIHWGQVWLVLGSCGAFRGVFRAARAMGGGGGGALMPSQGGVCV